MCSRYVRTFSRFLLDFVILPSFDVINLSCLEQQLSSQIQAHSNYSNHLQLLIYSMSSDPYLDPRGYRPFNLDKSDNKDPNTTSQPLAATADVLKVYEQAVQEPMVECVNLDSLYCSAQLEDTDRPEARLLREDFSSSGEYKGRW